MMTSFRLKILVAVSFANTVGLTSAASLEDAVSAPPPVAAKSYKDPLVAKAGKLIAKLAKTAVSRHPIIIHELVELGTDALDAIRAARDVAPAGPTRRALARAVTWIVAARLSEVMLAGIKTQLTFDGQYAEFRQDAKENLPALLAIIDDESVLFNLRITSCRALADIGDRSVVPRLRELHGDLLLPPSLREEIGIVLAVFGDTFSVRKDLQEYGRFARSPRATVRLSANLQLAHLYYRIRDYERAVETYEKIIELTRNLFDARKRAGLPKELLAPIRSRLTLHYYNAACSNSLNGSLERAKEYLRKAVEADPTHFSNIDKDGDLINLRRHESFPEFRKQLGKLFEEEEL